MDAETKVVLSVPYYGGDANECALLLIRVFELFDQHNLKWEYNIPTECIPLFFGSESSAILIEEI